MPVFYIIYQSFRKETVSELILRERWNTTQPTDGMTFYHVIGWPIKNVIAQLSRRPQSLTVVVIHISYMSRDAITQSLDRQLGMHNKIGAYHSFISRNLIMIIKVQNLQPLNLRWWKVPIPTGHVIFGYVILINEKLQITTFTKALRH